MIPQKSINFHVEHNGIDLIIDAKPMADCCKNGVPFKFHIAIDGLNAGTLECNNKGWIAPDIHDQELVEKIGDFIFHLYD